MAAIVATSLALGGCRSSAPTDVNAATSGADAQTGEDARNQLRAMSDQAFAGGEGADWVQRWWLNGVENGPFIDTDPVTPGSDQIKVTVKKDYNDAGKTGTGQAQGHALTVTLDGQSTTLTMVTGKDTGDAKLADRRRCVIVTPDKKIYCL